jgi:Domain of unknown function (DUF4082)/PEP-CTERM motif
MRKTSLALAFALSAGLTLPVAAFADGPAWEFATAGSSMNNGIGFSLGEVFTVNQNIDVTFLGYYATPGGQPSSLTEDHGVAIYDAAGNLLTSATINSGSGFSDFENFAFSSISPIELFAGQTYVIDGASGFVDPYAFNDNGFSVLAPISLLGDNFSTGNGDSFTGTTVIGDVSDGYWGPNFGFAAVAPTPEPSSLLLLGSGLVGFAGMLRRKLKA